MSVLQSYNLNRLQTFACTQFQFLVSLVETFRKSDA